MKRDSFVIAVFFFCCLLSCKNKNENQATGDESMQPYDAYPLLKNIEEIQEHLKGRCLDTIKFKPGEVIADVGAGNGYHEAMLSLFNDSLTFYIQDIDSAVCNPKTVNEVVAFYQNFKSKINTNRFITIIGNDNETNLPGDTFDKVLMLWTYQYFKNPGSIMTDIRSKLKSNGLLYIINPDIEYESGIKLSREHGWNASPIEKEISEILGCGFELIQIARNNYCCENPYILVFKKKK
jgi:protein-L-isoaspartate O-methyltransferase